ncbi:MAG: hypothetical protein ACK53L_04295, partial [Pirellulaceae bacterium]
MQAATFTQKCVFVLGIGKQLTDVFLDTLVGGFGFLSGQVFDVVGCFKQVIEHRDDGLTRKVDEFFV